MGYTTSFSGSFNVSPLLKPEHAAYLRKFNETRRMSRSSRLAEKMEDPVRIAVGLPVGPNGAYFVGGLGFMGQDADASILDYNRFDATAVNSQPGLWCQWCPNEEGTEIGWDGGEKFYDYVPWIKYLIEHFLAPWGYSLNGMVEWVGEDTDSDRGRIQVVGNVVKVIKGCVRVEFEDGESKYV